MRRYDDVDGDSWISAYQVRPDSIVVQYRDGATYIYSHQSAGIAAIETMKRLAASGEHLYSFINKFVREAWAEKLW
jgi:hypothetical protein